MGNKVYDKEVGDAVNMLVALGMNVFLEPPTVKIVSIRGDSALVQVGGNEPLHVRAGDTVTVYGKPFVVREPSTD